VSTKQLSRDKETPMSPQFHTWAAITGTAAVATLSLLVPAAAGASQIHTTPLRTLASTSVQPHGSKSTPHGGSQLGQHRLLSDKATEVNMQFTNKTGQTLTLTDSSRSGDGAHWDKQAPTSLAPGASGFATAYSATNITVDLTYTGASDGAVFKMEGVTDLAKGNSSSGSSSSASYTVSHSIGGGWNPTASYSIEPGGTFNYTGKTTTYTVPVGITQLNVEAIGGGTTAYEVQHVTTGADITGKLAVTPGEKLLIGAAGAGGNLGTGNNYAGGWGMTAPNGDNYSGGNTETAGSTFAQPGGGATVVLDEDNGTVLVVAGGGGGGGDVSTSCDEVYNGGNGGEGGSLTGGNGNPSPGPGGGGAAGANDSTTGQSSTGTDDCAGGAGGGGVKGGLAGSDGAAAGGGAGSSSVSGLSAVSIKAGSSHGGNVQAGSVYIGPTN
jgi:hypothetical protein